MFGNYFLQLPDEIILIILENLDNRSLLRSAQLERRFYALANDKDIWKERNFFPQFKHLKVLIENAINDPLEKNLESMTGSSDFQQRSAILTFERLYNYEINEHLMIYRQLLSGSSDFKLSIKNDIILIEMSQRLQQKDSRLFAIYLKMIDWNAAQTIAAAEISFCIDQMLLSAKSIYFENGKITDEGQRLSNQIIIDFGLNTVNLLSYHPVLKEKLIKSDLLAELIIKLSKISSNHVKEFIENALHGDIENPLIIKNLLEACKNNFHVAMICLWKPFIYQRFSTTQIIQIMVTHANAELPDRYVFFIDLLLMQRYRLLFNELEFIADQCSPLHKGIIAKLNELSAAVSRKDYKKYSIQVQATSLKVIFEYAELASLSIEIPPGASVLTEEAAGKNACTAELPDYLHHSIKRSFIFKDISMNEAGCQDDEYRLFQCRCLQLIKETQNKSEYPILQASEIAYLAYQYINKIFDGKIHTAIRPDSIMAGFVSKKQKLSALLENKKIALHKKNSWGLFFSKQKTLQKVSAIENSLTLLDTDVNDETQLKQFAKKLLVNRPLIGHRSFFHLPLKTDTEKQLAHYNATVLQLK